MTRRSLFVEVSALTPARVVELLDEILANHRNGTDRVDNLVLANVADNQGNLFVPQLDAIRPYLVGGTKQACDNTFVASGWVPWSPDAYGADKSQWYNHYAFWGGILNAQYRWDNINLAARVWRAFKDRYPLPFMHFYITPEADLVAFTHPSLGTQVRAAFEAMLIEMCRVSKTVEDGRSVIWSPFHWQPFRQVPAATREQLRLALRTMLTNIAQHSGQGINFFALQDGVGARPGVITKEDAAALFSLIRTSYTFYSLGMNVEWFSVTPTGLVPSSTAASREAWYESQNIPIGASWELRWFAEAHTHQPAIPPIEFLTRAQWGARTNLPPLGFFVPGYRRTEVVIHHTATIDGNDSTPNRWSRQEAINYMRALQTARPDLGRDIPFTYVFFVLEDLSVLICEGRGLYKTGAHTAGHNTAGFGWAVGGNFDIADPNAARAFLAVAQNQARYLKAHGFPNLCSRKNPRGWDFWGHRDTRSTTCPGNTLYPELATVVV